METDNIRFTYMRTPLYRYTFKNRKIRQWVERHCEGYVLNLFAGKTRLNANEIRNDLRGDLPCDYHLDALDFVLQWKDWVDDQIHEKFDTIILDPPYSFRKSMEMYDGVKSSRFNQVKNNLSNIMNPNGIVITFGYHSNSMGKNRGFVQEHILLLSHGGSIHDTICVIERKQNDEFSREELSSFFPI